MITELHQQQSTSDDKKKVLEMLQRVEEPEEEEWDDEEDSEELDSDDEVNDGGDLADRLAEVDLNNAEAIWERLTDEEKQEFKSLVHNGEIEKIVESFEPWWTQKLDEKLVSDIKKDEKDIQDLLATCPKVPTNIKDFQKISTKSPAACIIFNIANVIAAQTFIFRYYNGDHHGYEHEAADNLISICENLKTNANFESIVSVADSVMLNCHDSNLFSDLNTKKLILEDVKMIFDGPGHTDHAHAFIFSSLSDSIRLLKAGKPSNRKRQETSTNSEPKKKFSAEFLSTDARKEFRQLENQIHVSGCIKKIEFYLSFIKCRYNDRDWPISWETLC